MSLKYFTRKANILKRAKEEGKLLCNKGLTHYFVLDDYVQFLQEIKGAQDPDYYEYIQANSPVPVFFDIEIYADSADDLFTNFTPVLEACFNRTHDYIKSKFEELDFKKIVLESHSPQKRSFHLILRFTNTKTGKEILFDSVDELKFLYKDLKFDEFKDSNGKAVIDKSVYREGLFRTLYSSKTGQARPLVKSDLSDDFEDLESFIGWKSSGEYDRIEMIDALIPVQIDQAVNVPQELSENDITTIKKFVQREFHHYPTRIRDVLVDEQYNCIVIALDERYCPFMDREHKSNNGYIVIDTTSAKQKCHDSECREHKYNELKLEAYPKEINEIIKKCLKVNQQELQLIDSAIIECKNYITENFDHEITNVSFDRAAMIFRGNVGDRSLAKILKGKCPECNVEHQISDTGYCLKCTKCSTIFPKNQLIPVDNRYKALNNFWSSYNQLVNNGTINNIINIYNGADIEFSCDIKLDNSILRNKEVTNIVNQVLDGHKITMISKLMHSINKNFVYSRNNWYYFTGSIWKSDSDNIEMKKEIMDLSKLFDRIKTHYELKQEGDSLSKNIKSLINKFHKPGFQDDVIKGAKIYYNDEKFITNLNSKKHLVPFTNGVYNLLENKFRKTKKDDFVNLTVNYDFHGDANNREVYTFLEQVLPNEKVRDFVLKKMSECLNGDIPNTYFLMFIGDSGANGKSQLLNLMKLAMGDMGEKVEVTLLTRKRNNANEANSEKVKLLNKRFAFLSEPEDGEKINIGLLKELTGSEEIVARGLYQESISFVMEAKLFLACNELPEIKGEDTALWRRIRVVDFPSRFVDDPVAENEFKIDRTLPSRMREDMSWRQTFMKILLDYYYKDVREPVEVQVKTNEYRQENNDFYNWLEENIEYKNGEILQVKDICELFLGKTRVHSSQATKIRKEVEKWIKEKYPLVKWEFSMVKIGEKKSVKGWKDFCFKGDA